MPPAPIPIAAPPLPAYVSLPIPDSVLPMRAFSFADEWNVTTQRAGIGAGSPVFGLRPFRARLSRTLKLPIAVGTPVAQRPPRRSGRAR